MIKPQFSNLTSGRQVRVKHIRYGHELKEIALDKHYDFNFQVSNEIFCFCVKIASYSATLENTKDLRLLGVQCRRILGARVHIFVLGHIYISSIDTK